MRFLLSYCILGLVGYTLVYWANPFMLYINEGITIPFCRLDIISDDELWERYFNIDKLMDISIVFALGEAIFAKPNRTIQYKILFILISFSKLIDILSDFDNKFQQGNYAEILAHSFGITMCIALLYYYQKNNIAKLWGKYLQKSH